MTAIVNGSVIVKKKPSGKRVIFASAFGNALEFFDFGVYNFFVVYISTLFFPPSADKNVALLLAFATFGVSFFMRPLGGIIVGAWADRFGRKPAMVFTIALMSLGTLMIGIAPTYATKATIVNGVLLAIGSTVATYISLFYYGTWAAKYLAMPQHYSHAAMLLAGVITFVGALLVGMLCDSVGRKKLILISRVMVLICSWPSFWLLVNYPSPGMLLTVVFVMVSFTTLGGVPVMLLISELLPKRIRALGFALVYSIGVAIFGGFAQYFATQSIVLLDSLTAPAWYLGGGTLLSMLALLYVKEPAKELQ